MFRFVAGYRSPGSELDTPSVPSNRPALIARAIGCRVLIVGDGGAGKTTLARLISALSGIAHVELDELYWGPNWTPVGPIIFLKAVNAAVHRPEWIIEGVYSREALTLAAYHADAVVWLDYPVSIFLPRLIARSFRRWWYGDRLWAGNREEFLRHVTRTDSLFLSAIRDHRTLRVFLAGLRTRTQTHGVTWLCFSRPRLLESWLLNERA